MGRNFKAAEGWAEWRPFGYAQGGLWGTRPSMKMSGAGTKCPTSRKEREKRGIQDIACGPAISPSLQRKLASAGLFLLALAFFCRIVRRR